MKLREKTTATLLIAIFMMSAFAVAIPVSAHPADVILDHTPEWNPFAIEPGAALPLDGGVKCLELERGKEP